TSPRGNFEEVISNSATQTLTIKGWTFDQDTPTPISIHATINGTPHTVTANTSRPDVQRAFALNRNTTGFALTLPAQPGTHTICVTALNQGAGHNTPLGCRTTTL
ncbi:hypothetical protein, partial [Schaalia canis]|uniref:hypothetical protein n=1 Tax=Schaalia canis TaxID=100469 RepID=UPI00196A2D1A